MLAVLVLWSGVVFAVETLPSLTTEQFLSLAYTENIICIIFGAEYIARWYANSLRPSYVFEPFALIDLASFLPIVVQLAMGDPDATMGAGLGVLRLLRVLRLQRYFVDLDSFRRFEASLGFTTSTLSTLQLEVARVTSSVLTLLFVSTGLIYEAEHATNPQIPDYFTALYFGLTTLTTVGFGDITPQTFWGRLVVCGSIVAGVAIVPVQLASLGESLFGTRRAEAGSGSGAGVAAAPAQMLDGAQGGVGLGGSRLAAAGAACAACGEAAHLRAANYCHCCGARLDA